MAKFRKSISGRVESWFDTKENGKEKNMPFDIGVVADLSGAAERQEDVREREFVGVKGAAGLENLLSRLRPRVELDVQFDNQSDLPPVSIEIEFEKMSDFLPDGILAKLMDESAVERLVAVKSSLRDARWKLLEDESFRLKIANRIQEKMS